jgi:oligoendopeptidase F
MDTLPWVATIDKFQHWLYENPTHTHEDRTKAWNETYSRFASKVVDWDGLQKYKDNIWQKQLHIYEVPFYYIEYGMAQLGAIAVWKNYKENPEKGLKNYMDALSLGYSKSIKNVYETAGIKFDFSASYIKELMDFVKLELAKCK